MGTLTDYLDAIAPNLSPDLISAEFRRRLSGIGQHFPDAIASLVGFECRLADPTPQADLFFRVSPETGGRDIVAGSEAVETQPQFYHLLAGYETIPSLDDQLIDHPIWQKIRQFCTQWSTPNTSFYDYIKDLWLEFDLDAEPPAIPIPSVFLGSSAIAHLSTHLNPLLEHPLTSEKSQRIERTLNALPKTAKLFQSGVLLSREPHNIRFYISDISIQQICPYLDRIGWQGDRHQIAAILAFLSPGIKTTNLQIEIETDIAPTIAIECYLENREAWKLFLEGLVKTGFCLPQKRDAILSFGGLTREGDSPENWPGTLRRRSQLLGPGWESVLFRRLAYLKLIYRPGIPLEFKAYLGVQPGWIDTQSWGVKLE